jgi:hypothetical protein
MHEIQREDEEMDTLVEDRMPRNATVSGNEFKEFAHAVEARFRAMSSEELFTVDASDLFDAYLASFPAGTNPLFRVRTEHDCSCCKNFVRNIGHVVSLKGGTVSTVWDVPNLAYPYDVVAKTLDDLVRQMPIKSVFRTKESKFGAAKSLELRDGKTHQWNHFFCDVPARNRTAMPDQARGEINTAAQVFKRGLDELSLSAIETVLDLIASNSLYRGAEHKRAVDEFASLKRSYDTSDDKNLFAWANVGNSAARFRNTVIGTLVTDISAGVALEDAVRMFESKVAPQNYKRTTALITPKMIDGAVAELRAIGLETAVDRRYAKLSDVSVNNVLFVDNSVKSQMKDGLAGLLMSSVKPAAVDIKHAENIGIDDFLARVVPQATSIDLLLKNNHLGNFVSITAPVHADAGRLFKWDNGFAWSYDGDVTDSIKERVKRAGGNVEAALRVSLAWHNADDLDMHALGPEGHVYYSDKKGILDVDMNGLDRHDPVNPVENLSWVRPRDGSYKVYVHQFNQRSSERGGFEIEFFFKGDVKTFAYPKVVRAREEIAFAEFTMKGGEITSFVAGSSLTATSGSQEKWGVSTETLIPVDTLMASPNHWDEQSVGNKHWFFILKGCKNPGSARGIYNEFLRPQFEPHRKVFEVLGAKTKCPPSDDQLSGVGFSSTRGDQVTLIAKGDRINKAFNVQF